MESTWPDLTAQIEPVHQQAFGTIGRAAAAVNADWFLTGAMARDWVFTLINGIDTLRATRDADIGIALAGWDEFEQVRTHILEEGEFSPDRIRHRLNHRHLRGFHIDLVPFGRLSSASAEISWPPKQDIVMNVIGFQEAFNAAITVLADVDLPVKVASPSGLMLMKVFAWEDRKHLQPTGKDAQDIRLLLTRYENVTERKLHDVAGLMEAEDFDSDLAAARLLGRDVTDLLTPVSSEALLPILDRELGADSASILIEQLSRGGVWEASTEKKISRKCAHCSQVFGRDWASRDDTEQAPPYSTAISRLNTANCQQVGNHMAPCRSISAASPTTQASTRASNFPVAPRGHESGWKRCISPCCGMPQSKGALNQHDL